MSDFLVRGGFTEVGNDSTMIVLLLVLLYTSLQHGFFNPRILYVFE